MISAVGACGSICNLRMHMNFIGVTTLAASSVPWPLAIAFIVVAGLVVARLWAGDLVSLYVQALFSGAPVPLTQLIGMRLRRANVRDMVYSHIRATKAGLHLDIRQLETCHLAGANVPALVTALIAAKSARIPLTFDQACAIERAGRDIVDDVQASVNPKEVVLPALGSGRSAITAQAGDGERVKFRVVLVLRTRLDRVIGGASQAVVGERVEAALKHLISAMQDHQEVFGLQDQLAAGVAAMRLDAGAACEILELRIVPA